MQAGLPDKEADIEIIEPCVTAFGLSRRSTATIERPQPAWNRQIEGQFRSDCRRWVLPGVRMLTATKRLLGTAIDIDLSGCSRGYCGHKVSEILLAQRY